MRWIVGIVLARGHRGVAPDPRRVVITGTRDGRRLRVLGVVCSPPPAVALAVGVVSRAAFG